MSTLIHVGYKPSSSVFMGVRKYAEYYAELAREAIAVILNDPSIVHDAYVSMGIDEAQRDVSTMMDNVQGYCVAMAETAYSLGVNLIVMFRLGGIYTKTDEFGRMGMVEKTRKTSQMPEERYKVYDRLPLDHEKPTKYLLIEEKPHMARRYTGGGALIGFNMQATLLEEKPVIDE